MAPDTVELPADPDIKQLANDVVREDNEYAVPLLRDFYRFLAGLDEDDPTSLNDLAIEETDSAMRSAAWCDLLDTLEANGIVDRHAGSPQSYTLGEAAIEE